MTISPEPNELPGTCFDVVVVGSGAAALAAATTAARDGASVAVLEAAGTIGGTTAKSSGGFWVPRNRHMRERATTDPRFADDRDGCLAHMARLSFPEQYDRHAERHGLSPSAWDLIVNYYDRAAEALADLEATGDLPTLMMASFRGDDLGMPTWFETEEDGATFGRLLVVEPFDETSAASKDPHAVFTATKAHRDLTAMAALGSTFGDGVDLVRRLQRSAKSYGARIAVEHRVRELVFAADGAVTGVIADTATGPVTINALQGVIFGSGGMEHDPDLRERFLRGPIVGTCGASENRGDFIRIAERHGIALSNTAEGWWSQLPLEPCLESFEQGDLMGSNYGDSMIVVSADGERVVNEKESYNERGKIHSTRAANGSYPLRLLIQICDDALIQDSTEWPARWPTPTGDEIPDYVIVGDTLEDLTDRLTQRLAELSDQTDGFALAPTFATTLRASIARFNRFAETGVDEDFGRGSTSPQKYFSVEFRSDPKPNHTMYPIADHGPYYAILIGASVLGTKGGPTIDTESRVLRTDGSPVPGLYGAGNCIGSPAGEAYWGGGGTLGPALFHGYLAGKNAVREPRRSPTPA